ncbi:7629_t:CDS:2 [Entrophospora sp. SA101]|nr:7629_t:CDS:2 [Entrophospora sp. SA101]
MSWHSLANPDIKEREDGLGTGQLHRQGKNFIPVDEKTLLEIQKKKRNNSYQKNNHHQSKKSQDSSNWKTKPKQNDTNQDTLKSKANDNNNNNNGISSSTKPKSKTKTKPAIKDSQSDQNNKPASKPAKNKSHQNNYNIPFIPPEFDSTPYWNQSSSPLPSSPSSSPPPTDDEVEIDDSPAVEKTPRRVDKHERGERLLTINVELEKDCSQTIYVHVNDDPADLAKDFCDLWKITNTAVVPELEKLIREEREKTVLSNRRKLRK